MMGNFSKLEAITSNYSIKEWQRPPFRCLSSKFWTLWKQKWKHGEDAESVRVRTLFKDANSSLNTFEKRALNYPCQGTGADMTKLALIKVYEWIIDNGYFNTVKIVNAVHDEIVLEAPEELSERVAKVLIDSMESAGSVFCKTIPIKADYEIGTNWVH